MKLDITSFTGEVPWLDSRLLEDTQAKAAIDCRLTNGSLRAYYAPAEVQALNDTPQQSISGQAGRLYLGKDHGRQLQQSSVPGIP